MKSLNEKVYPSATVCIANIHKKSIAKLQKKSVEYHTLRAEKKSHDL
jgi:hypothetical protein